MCKPAYTGCNIFVVLCELSVPCVGGERSPAAASDGAGEEGVRPDGHQRIPPRPECPAEAGRTAALRSHVWGPHVGRRLHKVV